MDRNNFLKLMMFDDITTIELSAPISSNAVSDSSYGYTLEIFKDVRARYCIGHLEYNAAPSDLLFTLDKLADSGVTISSVSTGGYTLVSGKGTPTYINYFPSLNCYYSQNASDNANPGYTRFYRGTSGTAWEMVFEYTFTNSPTSGTGTKASPAMRTSSSNIQQYYFPTISSVLTGIKIYGSVTSFTRNSTGVSSDIKNRSSCYLKNVGSFIYGSSFTSSVSACFRFYNTGDIQSDLDITVDGVSTSISYPFAIRDGSAIYATCPRKSHALVRTIDGYNFTTVNLVGKILPASSYAKTIKTLDANHIILTEYTTSAKYRGRFFIINTTTCECKVYKLSLPSSYSSYVLFLGVLEGYVYFRSGNYVFRFLIADLKDLP